MKYTQQVWRWTQEMLECLLDNCNSGHKHNIDCNIVYKGVLQIPAFVFCNSVQLIPDLTQCCIQNCCINITNPSPNQWRRCRRGVVWAIWCDVAHISRSLCAGIPCKAPGEMGMGKGWLLVPITEHKPALCPAEIQHNLHCGAPASLNKNENCGFLWIPAKRDFFACLVNGNFVSHAY